MELDELQGPSQSKPFWEFRTAFQGSPCARGPRGGQAMFHQTKDWVQQTEDFTTSQRCGNSWSTHSTAPGRVLLSRTSQTGPQRAPFLTLRLGKLRQGELGEAQVPLWGCFAVLLASPGPQSFPGSVLSSSDPNKHSLSGQPQSTSLG